MKLPRSIAQVLIISLLISGYLAGATSQSTSYNTAPRSTAFIRSFNSKRGSSKISRKMAAPTPPPGTNFCDLPGDPSLILTTNVDLGDKKMEIMKGEGFSALGN